MEIKIMPHGELPADYGDESSPAGYVIMDKVCGLYRSKEWDMMVKLGLEIEYTTLILTHEQIHETTYEIYWRYKHKKFHNIKRERLLHKSDICALMGF
jgi:hypothetical protein